MIKFWLFVLLAITVAFVPLSLGLVVGIKFRHREAPPLWLGFLLLSLAIGSATALIYPPQLPMLVSRLIVSGTVVSGVVGAASILRRISGVTFPKALLVSAVVALSLLVWADLRFRVVVQDRNGMPVDVRDGDMSLHHPPEGLQSYQTAKGLRVKKGTTYFGLIRWLQFKDRWTFPGALTDEAGGRRLVDLKWERARWSEWPKRVTTD